LAKTATRLCLDRLTSARARHETYVGPWLPEPLVEELPEAPVEAAQELSMALMLALERLSPLERAVFLLHDVFEMGFQEIAVILERSEAACRQLAVRARGQVRHARQRFAVTAEEGRRIALAFIEAARSGDVARLQDLLASDAVLRTDGGGRRIAALNPIFGRDRIARFYAGTARKRLVPLAPAGPLLLLTGCPGCIGVEADGLPQATCVEIADGRIGAVYVMRNPDKLRHLDGSLFAAAA
jgi:RNA polymerase sigma-70 factor (ECF subfamily)